RVAYLEEGDCVALTRKSATFYDAAGKIVTREVRLSNAAAVLLDKGEHRHFMAKEIFEQPEVVGHTLAASIDPLSETVRPPALPFDLAKIGQVTLTACGTAYYAALVGKYWIERLARIPVSVDIPSEFRYPPPALPPPS